MPSRIIPSGVSCIMRNNLNCFTRHFSWDRGLSLHAVGLLCYLGLLLTIEQRQSAQFVDLLFDFHWKTGALQENFHCSIHVLENYRLLGTVVDLLKKKRLLKPASVQFQT